jgi:hypothetical protein
LTATITNDAPLVVNNAYGWTGSYTARCQTWLSAGSEVARMMANGSMILSANITASTFKATQNIPSDVSFGGNGSGNGMYMPSGNVTAIATSSTERMRIDSSGNVMVNTTTAGGLVTIKGTTASGNVGSLVIQDSVGNPLFRVDNSKCVGVNTTNPTASIMSVGRGTTSATTNLLIQNNGNSRVK